MKNHSSILAAIFSASLISSLPADTFVLKDGTKLEAEVISEKADSYLLSVEVVKGIRDEKTVKKSDVVNIIKSDQSLAAYEELKKLTPTPDLLEAEDYERVLAEKIAPFIENYPKSKHLAKVKALQSKLEEEMEIIKAGGVKLDGKLITSDERQMDLYDINARIKYSQISRLAKSQAFSPAMQHFEVMEQEYRHTQSFDKAVDLVEAILPAFKTQLEQLIAKSDDAIKQREVALDRMDHGDKLRTQRIFAAEEEKYQQQIAEAKAKRSRWLPINRYHPKEMTTVLRAVDREMKRISRLREKETIDAGAAYRETMAHLDKNEVELAKESFTEFKRARPPKEFINDLEQRILNAIETIKQIEEEKKREAEELARKAAEEEDKKTEDGKAKEKE